MNEKTTVNASCPPKGLWTGLLQAVP